MPVIQPAVYADSITHNSPVLYYSNDILSKALPDLGPYVSLGITIVNTIMTAAPIFLIDVRLLVALLRFCSTASRTKTALVHVGRRSVSLPLWGRFWVGLKPDFSREYLHPGFCGLCAGRST